MAGLEAAVGRRSSAGSILHKLSAKKLTPLRLEIFNASGREGHKEEPYRRPTTNTQHPTPTAYSAGSTPGSTYTSGRLR